MGGWRAVCVCVCVCVCVWVKYLLSTYIYFFHHNICLVELGLIPLTPLQMQKLMFRNFKKIAQGVDC